MLFREVLSFSKTLIWKKSVKLSQTKGFKKPRYGVHTIIPKENCPPA